MRAIMIWHTIDSYKGVVKKCTSETFSGSDIDLSDHINKKLAGTYKIGKAGKKILHQVIITQFD